MKILVVEDNDDHFELVVDAIDEFELSVTVEREATMTAGLRRLATKDFDVCLMDLVLPDSSLAESVPLLQKQSISTPIVALTSIKDTKIAESLLAAGIQDYIPKDEMTPFALYRTCRYAIQRKQYLTEIEKHNQDMNAFCASLSHDFLSSIHRISQVTSILKSNLSKRITFTEDDLRWLSYLTHSTEEIDQLVKDLRQYLSIRGEDLVKEVVNLNALLFSLEDNIRVSISDNFLLERHNTDIDLYGNRSLFYLLFQNILANGIKYCDNTPKMMIKCEQVGKMTVIQITDNGIGFENSNASKIFEPFSRLNSGREGSGLGLSICHRIVLSHGGDISAKSSPGQGSTFTLKIPSALNPISNSGD